MKIIHIISSLSRGGRERQLATIVKYDYCNLNKIVCLNKTTNNYIKEYSLEDKLILLPSKSFISRITKTRKIIKAVHPDIIWTWGGFETTLVFLVRIFCKEKFRIVNGSIRHGIVKLNRKQLWRLILLHLSKYRVANSYAGIKANKLKNGFVLYNGIDKNLIAKNKNKFKESEKLRNLLKIDPQCLVLISVANLVPYKDYFTVLHSLKLLKSKNQKFKYLIIGEGQMRKKIEDKLREYNLTNEVFLLGRQKNIPQWLSLSDIFIHSSRGEGFSNALLEAMANGLPIVATNTGGTGEMISSDIGLLFEYKDSIKLYEHILELMENKELRYKLGNKACKVVEEKYSTDVMINNYNLILKKVQND